MLRAFVISVSALAITMGCTPSFKDRRTPSGDFCSDMAIIPANEEPNVEYHRLTPVQSDIKARTEAERLESLRKAACAVGADAVIEAVNEETRNEQAQYVKVSSGTAVIFVRPKDSEPVPLTTHKKTPPADTTTPATTSDPAPTPTSAPVTSSAPTATATAAPVATTTPAATPTAAPTSAPTAAPTSTSKSKLPTNAAPKPIKPKK